jgi:hypothetical protein
MTNYNDGNWHGWSGGDCPVHESSEVEALWIDPKGKFCKVENIAENIAWGGSHRQKSDDPISAFRVTKEYRAPRELWVGVLSGLTSNTYQPGMVLFREVLE